MTIFEDLNNVNLTDANGDPAGGEFWVKTVDGEDVLVGKWQDGPIAEQGENGIGVENLLSLAIDRLAFYQNSRFACAENDRALTLLRNALGVLNARTARRTKAGVEGRNIATPEEGKTKEN